MGEKLQKVRNMPQTKSQTPRPRQLAAVQGGVAFGKKAKPSTPMDKLMHNDYMTGD
jgi:hypothetical protein